MLTSVRATGIIAMIPIQTRMMFGCKCANMGKNLTIRGVERGTRVCTLRRIKTGGTRLRSTCLFAWEHLLYSSHCYGVRERAELTRWPHRTQVSFIARAFLRDLLRGPMPVAKISV